MSHHPSTPYLTIIILFIFQTSNMSWNDFKDSSSHCTALVLYEKFHSMILFGLLANQFFTEQQIWNTKSDDHNKRDNITSQLCSSSPDLARSPHRSMVCLFQSGSVIFRNFLLWLSLLTINHWKLLLGKLANEQLPFLRAQSLTKFCNKVLG